MFWFFGIQRVRSGGAHVVFIGGVLDAVMQPIGYNSFDLNYITTERV